MAASRAGTVAGGRVPANKGRKYPAEVLRPEEVTALLRACSTRAPSGIRNRALIAVLYRGGLRLAEALALLPKDVDLTRGAVRVLHGKGDQARTVALDPGALALEKAAAATTAPPMKATPVVAPTAAAKPTAPPKTTASRKTAIPQTPPQFTKAAPAKTRKSGPRG